MLGFLDRYVVNVGFCREVCYVYVGFVDRYVVKSLYSALCMGRKILHS